MATIEELVAELEAFKTANQLAAYLQTQHVTGLRNEGDCCPVANYVSEKSLRPVSVTPDDVTSIHVQDNEKPVQVRYTNSIIPTFIDMFDDGEFPWLDEAEDE